MVRIALALALPFAAALMLGPVPVAAADVVCRPDMLGTVSCPDAPRPKPRPVYRSTVQALERIRAPQVGVGQAATGSTARQGAETFVPSRETRRLGGTMMLPQGTAGPCRPDMLGNLNCR
jgi:hypothetical protein